MSVKNFFNSFKEEQKPIYIFETTDTFFKKQIFKFLTTKYHQFSFQHFLPQDNTFSEVIEAFKNPTLFGERFFISYGIADKLLKKEKELLLKILDNQENYKDKNILLIFLKKFNKNDSILNLAKKKGCYFKLVPPKDYQLKQYIVKFFQKHNLKVDSEVPDYLISNLNNNLEAISLELYKIVNSDIQSKIITVEILEKIIAPVKEESIYKLIDFFMDKRKNDCLKIFHNLLQINSNIENILNIFISTINILILIKSGKISNMADEEIISKFNIHPYAFKINLSRVKKFSLNELYAMLNSLIKTQLAIRKKGINPKQAFLHFLLFQDKL